MVTSYTMKRTERTKTTIQLCISIVYTCGNHVGFSVSNALIKSGAKSSYMFSQFCYLLVLVSMHLKDKLKTVQLT